jgi:hypothetical protein
MILYRPVGHRELELICEAGFRTFPPRLPEQPIFYPVLNASYARQIAEGWNTKSDTHAGYVTRFNIKKMNIQENFKRKSSAANNMKNFGFLQKSLQNSTIILLDILK